jgi:hypothetical protein
LLVCIKCRHFKSDGRRQISSSVNYFLVISSSSVSALFKFKYLTQITWRRVMSFTHEALRREDKNTVDYFCSLRKDKKRWSYPCNRPWSPIGLWDVEAPTFSLENRLTYSGKFVSRTHRQPLILISIHLISSLMSSFNYIWIAF